MVLRWGLVFYALQECLMIFPLLVFFRHAFRARAEPSGDGRSFILEENPVLYVVSVCDEVEGRGAVEPTVDSELPVSAQLPRRQALVNLSVRSHQPIHEAPST